MKSKLSKLPFDKDNQEFVQALDYLENTPHHLFITGEAGSGKSTLLQYFVQNTIKNVVVLAPTGLAAINAGGQTIHRFCRFPPQSLTQDSIKEIKIPAIRKLIRSLDTIVIDEVSMVRADILDGIDLFLRLNRHRDEPFGGVQMVFMGDLLQLPPVLTRTESDLFFSKYDTPYFFSSRVANQIDLQCFELQKNYRQQGDDTFLKILRAIKSGQHSPELLNQLNQRVNPASIKNFEITISTTNAIAQQLNEEMLNKLPGKSFDFSADIHGQFNERDCPADGLLKLKKGAQIMFLKNDVDGKWVNGTIGIIESVSEFKICVQLENGKIHEVEPEKWEAMSYEFDEELEEVKPVVTGYLEQYPIKLAWGVTIHKSQGQTFDNVSIDLGYGAFAHGQTYVALSRCRSLNGIYLKRPIQPRDIIIDPHVTNFLNQLNQQRTKQISQVLI